MGCAVHPRFKIRDGDIHQTLAGGASGPRLVGSDEAIWRGEERAPVDRRLDREHVEAGTGNAILAQSFGEIGFHDEGTAAGVQEVS